VIVDVCFPEKRLMVSGTCAYHPSILPDRAEDGYALKRQKMVEQDIRDRGLRILWYSQ
jgi:hypothetical protein